MFRTLIDKTERALEYAIGLLCLVLLVALFVEVLNRYVFQIAWATNQFIIPFCLLWMCMLGAALAVRHNRHFEVDLLAHMLSGTPQKMHRTLMLLTVLAAGIVIVWSSISFVELGMIKKSPATGTKMIWIYASLPVGGALIALMALDRLLASDEPASNEPTEEESA